VMGMEIGAGYNVTWVTAERAIPEMTVEALAFTWPWAEYGHRIPSGDWRDR
jgi:hypothetical protein